MPRSRITTQFAFEEVNANVLQRVNRGIGQFTSFVFSPAGAIAGAAALGAAVTGVTARYLENADALQKMSLRTGLGTEELGALQFAFEQNDLSASDLQRTISRLNDQGLNLDQFADEIAGIEDFSVRTSRAVDVLGERLGPRLLTVLDAGSEGLNRYREQHQRLNLAIDQESANAAAQFNDNIDTISRVVEGAGNRIGQGIINWAGPILQAVGTTFGLLPESADVETERTINEFITRLADARATGQSLGEALTDPVIAQLAEMARQAGLQTAAALQAADQEVLRRSAQATGEAYRERYLDIQQDIALGAGEPIRPHRNLPIPPGTEGEFQPIGYDYDVLAGGGRREPPERSNQRTYTRTGYPFVGGILYRGIDPFQHAVPRFARGDPRSSEAIAEAFAIGGTLGGNGFNAGINREDAQIQVDAIRANRVYVGGGDGDGAGRGFAGGSISGQSLIEASKTDPVRVTVAGLGGLAAGAGENRSFRELRVDGDDLFNKEAVRDLVLALVQDYG